MSKDSNLDLLDSKDFALCLSDPQPAKGATCHRPQEDSIITDSFQEENVLFLQLCMLRTQGKGLDCQTQLLFDWKADREYSHTKIQP